MGVNEVEDFSLWHKSNDGEKGNQQRGSQLSEANQREHSFAASCQLHNPHRQATACTLKPTQYLHIL